MEDSLPSFVLWEEDPFFIELRPIYDWYYYRFIFGYIESPPQFLLAFDLFVSFF